MARITWTMDDKLNAAFAYIVTGNSIDAAKLCGIPDRTIRGWTNEDWWADIIGEARRMKNDELDASFTNIMHKAVKEIEDRMINGDEIVQKDGTVRKKKVSARDATLVAAVLVDKRAILRGEPTRISKTLGTEKERLKKLNDDLEGIVGVKEEEDTKENKAVH